MVHLWPDNLLMPSKLDAGVVFILACMLLIEMNDQHAKEDELTKPVIVICSQRNPW